MIKNEKQYQNAKKQLQEFNKAHQMYADRLNNGDETAFFSMKNVESLIEEMESDISEYEDLQNGKQTVVTLQSFGELPDLLIKARIAKNWTQADLAEKVKLNEQQIQKYESTDYAGASTWKLLFILDALEITTALIQVHVGREQFDTGLSAEVIDLAQQTLRSEKYLMAKTA